MPRACTVCQRPDRAAIEADIVADRSAREISALFRVSEDAVARHKGRHLKPRVMEARQAARQADEARALDTIAQLKGINHTSLAVLEEAREARDGELALKAVDRIHRQIELQAKLLGELDERPVVNLLIAPEWLALRGRLLAALAPYPAARLALAEALHAG